MNQPQPEGSSASKLKNCRSLGEILETAMSFERTARDFYRALTERVSKPVRGIVEELAKEEEAHCRLFEQLKNNPDVQAHIQDQIRTPPSDHRFSDYVHLPELTDPVDEQALLQYAMGREQAAMDQYSSLATNAPEGPARDLFRFLALEELRHKGELEKRYYALVYPSNV